MLSLEALGHLESTVTCLHSLSIIEVTEGNHLGCTHKKEPWDDSRVPKGAAGGWQSSENRKRKKTPIFHAWAVGQPAGCALSPVLGQWGNDKTCKGSSTASGGLAGKAQ